MTVVRYEDARGRGAYAVETGDCVTVSTPGVRHDHEFADMAEAVGWMESKGYRGPAGEPTWHDGHGSTPLLRERIAALVDDFAAGLMSADEFGEQSLKVAREYAGWAEW